MNEENICYLLPLLLVQKFRSSRIIHYFCLPNSSIYKFEPILVIYMDLPPITPIGKSQHIPLIMPSIL